MQMCTHVDHSTIVSALAIWVVAHFALALATQPATHVASELVVRVATHMVSVLAMWVATPVLMRGNLWVPLGRLPGCCYAAIIVTQAGLVARMCGFFGGTGWGSRGRAERSSLYGKHPLPV